MQMNGQYRVRSEKLLPLYHRAQQAADSFDKFDISWTERWVMQSPAAIVHGTPAWHWLGHAATFAKTRTDCITGELDI